MIEGHGDDRYRYGDIRMDFSSNVPGGTDRSSLEKFLASRMEVIGRYPEPEPYSLEREIASRHGISPESVIVTNGATEAIYLTAHLFSGCRTGIVEPTFAEYRDACRLYGHDIYGIPEKDFPGIPAEAFGTVWCCNPNNPTGGVIEPEGLKTIAASCPGTVFVLDCSYSYFTLKETLSPKEAVQTLPNAILIHSLTKHFAIPGLRIGYLTAPKDICDRLRQLRMPWSVNAMAIEAAMYLHCHGLPSVPVEELIAEAERVSAALESIGDFVPHHSGTHFFLVEMRKGTAADLKEWLAARFGILIRDAGNFPGLGPEFFRIAVQTPEENDELIKALRQWKQSH